jgi:hypothetical protein
MQAGLHDGQVLVGQGHVDLALVFVATGQADLAEHFGMLCTLVGDDASDAAGADNQDFAHGPL